MIDISYCTFVSDDIYIYQNIIYAIDLYFLLFRFYYIHNIKKNIDIN